MIYRKDIGVDEFEPYFKTYLDLIDPDADLFSTLEHSLEQSVSFIKDLKRPLDYTYATGKWTIGQVIQHNIDTERIFQYRALRFLRGDATALAGFDQDLFVDACGHIAFAKAELIDTLKVTRNNTVAIFKEATLEQLKFKGMASGKTMTARVIPFLIAGHNKHHERIIAQRY